MRQELIDAGISESEVSKVMSSPSLLIKQNLDFLRDHELANYLKVLSLHEQKAWDYIKLVRAFYLEEWQLLEQERKKLRKSWRRIFSTFVAETKNSKTRDNVSSHHASKRQPDGVDRSITGSTEQGTSE